MQVDQFALKKEIGNIGIGFEPLTAKVSRSKPSAFFSSKPVVPNLRGTRFSLPFSWRLGWLFNTLHRKKKEVFDSQEGRVFYTMDESNSKTQSHTQSYYIISIIFSFISLIYLFIDKNIITYIWKNITYSCHYK